MDALVNDELVESHLVTRSGSGRPPLAYATTKAGRRALAARHDQAHREVLAAMVEFCAASDDAVEQARSMGAAWGARQFSPPNDNAPTGEPDDEAMQLIERTLTELGFEPTRENEGRDDERGVLQACPLHDLATAHPEVVCTLHEAMVQTLVDRSAGRTQLKLLPFAEPGRCWLTRQQA